MSSFGNLDHVRSSHPPLSSELLKLAAQPQPHSRQPNATQRQESIGGNFKRSDSLQKRSISQEQKMAIISHVTGGIAHNFNNLLSGIIGFSDLMAQSPHDEPSRSRYLERISQAAQRGSRLVQQLLAFSQQQILSPEPLHLNRIVTETSQSLQPKLNGVTELELDLEPWPKVIEADPEQISQIINNLSQNAIEAMPEGGKLTLRTGVVQVTSFSMKHLGIAPGHYMVLEVEDTGCGIDEAIYDQIFEPFFSTKSELNGTGLGLSMVYGLVKQGGGEIRVSSTVGVGTCFKIYFPVFEAASTSDVGNDASKMLAGNHGKVQTILLAEDDPTIRFILKAFLTKLGYTVHAVTNGREGIDFSKEHVGQIDILLTDIVMPEVDGLELAQKTLESRSGTKVLFISGYSQRRDELSDLLGGRTQVDFLKKPFKNNILEKKIKELISQTDSVSAASPAA